MRGDCYLLLEGIVRASASWGRLREVVVPVRGCGRGCGVRAWVKAAGVDALTPAWVRAAD
ncbi:hypothetical protein GCM10009601_49670 [Streptomyces thermospinosisporus]|uniref:Uncharacterized protein n=1 Tax=Streptomyces thermospinosisporus TaxID=161482 RepID=A0ABN1Z4A1_9ACTN